GVEAAGVCAVPGGVVVRGQVGGQDRFALGDGDAGEGERGEGEAQRQVGDRRGPAQGLFDHSRPGDASVDHGGEVVGVGEQGVYGVGDQVDRGLVSTADDEQQRAA